MTISGWHDDARNKDSGHDEMQAAFWRHYRKDIGKRTITRVLHKPVRFLLTDVRVEFPFTSNRSGHDTGQIMGFADIAMIFAELITEAETAYRKKSVMPPKPERWHAFFEVKPRIYSVGAVIRQCRALENVAARSGYRQSDVYPVVYRDDPSTELLCELWPDTWTWDRPTP